MDRTLVELALAIAKLRSENASGTLKLEQLLYTKAIEKGLPESETTYLMELTETRVYN